MEKEKNVDIGKIVVPILLEGGIGVFPTDTIYGVIGSAFKKETVERIYNLRKRELRKPMIILVSSLNDLKKFGIKLNAKQKSVIAKLWPGKVSIAFDCHSKKLDYLHRGIFSLAPRLPNDVALIKILKKRIILHQVIQH
jgi:L-threonylcarbamoyladenylate synthase